MSLLRGHFAVIDNSELMIRLLDDNNNGVNYIEAIILMIMIVIMILK